MKRTRQSTKTSAKQPRRPKKPEIAVPSADGDTESKPDAVSEKNGEEIVNQNDDIGKASDNEAVKISDIGKISDNNINSDNKDGSKQPVSFSKTITRIIGETRVQNITTPTRLMLLLSVSEIALVRDGISEVFNDGIPEFCERVAITSLRFCEQPAFVDSVAVLEGPCTAVSLAATSLAFILKHKSHQKIFGSQEIAPKVSGVYLAPLRVCFPEYGFSPDVRSALAKSFKQFKISEYSYSSVTNYEFSNLMVMNLCGDRLSLSNCLNYLANELKKIEEQCSPALNKRLQFLQDELPTHGTNSSSEDLYKQKLFGDSLESNNYLRIRYLGILGDPDLVNHEKTENEYEESSKRVGGVIY